MTSAHVTKPQMSFTTALHHLQKEAQHGVLDTGRYRMRFARLGSGPPMVFIHGVVDRLESFAMLLDGLKDHFECIAYDLPTGQEDGAKLARYALADLLDDLKQLLDHLRLDRVVSFSHSFGTMIALAAMHQWPERISRSILTCGLAHGRLTRRQRWLARLGTILPGTMGHLWWRKRTLDRLRGSQFSDQPEEVWNYFAATANRPTIRCLTRYALLLDRTDVRPMLPTIANPTLIISGERDALVPSKHQMVIFKELRNSVMFLMSEAGHFPHLTHSQATVDAILQFLNAPGCAFASCAMHGTEAKALSCRMSCEATCPQPEPP